MAKRKPKSRCLKWSKGRKRCLRRARSRRLGKARLVGLGASFTRKHYTAVAKILCKTGTSAKTVNSFADYFAADNPSFKPSLFKKAASRC